MNQDLNQADCNVNKKEADLTHLQLLRINYEKESRHMAAFHGNFVCTCFQKINVIIRITML